MRTSVKETYSFFQFILIKNTIEYSSDTPVSDTKINKLYTNF